MTKDIIVILYFIFVILCVSCCTYSLALTYGDSKLQLKASTYPDVIVVTPQK